MSVGSDRVGSARPESKPVLRLLSFPPATAAPATDVFTQLARTHHADPSSLWNVLAQLDRRYRLGRINPEVFKAAFAHLQSIAIESERLCGGRPAATCVDSRPVISPSAEAGGSGEQN